MPLPGTGAGGGEPVVSAGGGGSTPADAIATATDISGDITLPRTDITSEPAVDVLPANDTSGVVTDQHGSAPSPGEATNGAAPPAATHMPAASLSAEGADVPPNAVLPAVEAQQAPQGPPAGTTPLNVAEASSAAGGGPEAPIAAEVPTTVATTPATPANVNVSVRVFSPGDNGPVVQTVASGAPGAGPPSGATPAASAAVAAYVVPAVWNWTWSWTWTAGDGPACDSPGAAAGPGSAGPGGTWNWTWNWSCAAPRLPIAWPRLAGDLSTIATVTPPATEIVSDALAATDPPSPRTSTTRAVPSRRAAPAPVLDWRDGATLAPDAVISPPREPPVAASAPPPPRPAAVQADPPYSFVQHLTSPAVSAAAGGAAGAGAAGLAIAAVLFAFALLSPGTISWSAAALAVRRPSPERARLERPG